MLQDRSGEKFCFVRREEEGVDFANVAAASAVL